MTIELVARPYWNILWNPTKTLRSLIYFEPSRGALWLAALAGVFYLPTSALTKLTEEDISASVAIVLFGLPIGMIQGICYLYITAYGMRLSSNWLGTPIRFQVLKQIIAWSYLPLCLGYFIVISIYGSIGLLSAEEEIPLIFQDGFLLYGLVSLPLVWSGYVQWSSISSLTSKKLRSLGIIVMPLVVAIMFIFLLLQLHDFLN